MIGRAKLDKEFFSAPPDMSHSFSAGNIAVQHGAGTYAIESLFTLEKLLAAKRSEKKDPILRFLVDKSGSAWFARETRPWMPAPKHYQMTGDTLDSAYCATAGTMKFKNSSYTRLKSINHQSGDFHPSFHSLRLFLAILIINEKTLPFRLPRILVVKEFNRQGIMICKHRWPVAHIKDWVHNFSHDQELMTRLSKQDADTKIVCYEALNLRKNEMSKDKNQALIPPKNPLKNSLLRLRKLFC
jgi:hypothetical protein